MSTRTRTRTTRTTRNRSRWLTIVPFAVPLIVAVIAFASRLPGDERGPVDLASTGPTYVTLDEMVAASDLVIVGTVRSLDDGRAITDPANPAAGIRTRLFDVTVEQVLAGPSAGGSGSSVVIEHEASLLDGTPVTVEGQEAPTLGERAVYFLVAGTTEQFPHHAIVGPQGRFLLSGMQLTAGADDPLSASLDHVLVADLAARL